jgi:hypothetical protein
LARRHLIRRADGLAGAIRGQKQSLAIQQMVDAVLSAGQVKGVGTKALMTGEQLLKLCNRPTAMWRRELKAVVGQHGVDRVRDVRDEPAQEVRRGAPCRPFV